KAMLATYSDYFHRYFGLAPVKSITSDAMRYHTIPICDYSYQVYRGYLCFIYTGSIYDSALRSKLSEQQLIKFLVELTELSLVYEETDLFDVCIREVTLPENSLMNSRWVSQIYNESYRYRVGPLMNRCTEFMEKHWDQMLQQPNFERWRTT